MLSGCACILLSQQGCSCSVPFSPHYETCLTLIHSAVTESFYCWVMQVVWAAFSGMLWLQSWETYSHPAVCLAPTMPKPGVTNLPIQVQQVRLLTWQPCSSCATCSALQPKLENHHFCAQASYKAGQVPSKEWLTESLLLAPLMLPKPAGIACQFEFS